MFHYDERLKHLLRPEHYASAEQHALEMERLFRPGWHFVGLTTELPHDGDYMTLELFGEPLLIRKDGGEYHAFLNVCAHRHCLITHEPKGHSPRIHCQYHGWEYDREGRTGKIPDARCFAPFERERARLHKFRLETCGDLLFVSLADEGPTLAEYLGPFYVTCETVFARPWQHIWSWEGEYACNWKIPVENSLETYHIPNVHPQTFGVQPDEECCEHDLAASYTTFRLDLRKNFGPTNQLQRRTLRMLGGPMTDSYTHHHGFPNLIFTFSDIFRMAQVLIPTSPTTCRTIVRLYSYRGDRNTPWAKLVAYLAAREGRRGTQAIMAEDAGLFADIQRGMRSARQPGVIGTREERIFVFQQYIARECGLETEDSYATQVGSGDGEQHD